MAKFLPVCEPLLNGNELTYVTEAVSTGWISSAGKYVSAFERAFADYCGVKHGIAVCNGTVALHLALVALGVGKGDEVIIPDFTMMASALAVCYTGAKPVFADADADTWNISPEAVAAKITPRTKVVMPVHIFGNPCDMAALHSLCDSKGIILMEDAAEAHGATLPTRTLPPAKAAWLSQTMTIWLNSAATIRIFASLWMPLATICMQTSVIITA